VTSLTWNGDPAAGATGDLLQCLVFASNTSSFHAKSIRFAVDTNGTTVMPDLAGAARERIHVI